MDIEVADDVISTAASVTQPESGQQQPTMLLHPSRLGSTSYGWTKWDQYIFSNDKCHVCWINLDGDKNRVIMFTCNGSSRSSDTLSLLV